MLGVTACGGGGGGSSSPTASSGNSDSSSGSSAVTPLSAPTVQSITKKASYKADVNWSTVTGASTYTVHLAKAPFTGQSASGYNTLPGYQKFENLTGNTTEVTLDGESVYHVIVTANNGTQTSASSSEKIVSYTALALNDTGIDKCGNFSASANVSKHNNRRDCSKTTDETNYPIPAGQDGHYATGYKNAQGEAQKGKKFTKVSNGQCVQDEHTGLMWEVKQAKSTGLHSPTSTFSWYNSDSNSNGGNAGTDYTQLCPKSSGLNCNTQAFVNAVNAQGLCGFKDWRLPTREELRSLADYEKPNNTIDGSFFPNGQDQTYWSSSPGSGNNEYAWLMNFQNGSDQLIAKSNKHRVRLVRAR